MFDDLRSFIAKVDELGECRVVEGADWNLEIGALTEIVSSMPDSPLLLFDKVKGYPPGYRVVSNIYTTQRRIALAYGLPLEAKGIHLIRALREKTKGGVRLIPSVEVKTGPIKENIYTGDDVDLFMFPTPKWHEHDGGRYIGTGTMTITRDPDQGWVNLGAYRVEIHDKVTATVSMAQGQHGDIMRKKYWAKGQPCLAAVVCGQEPMMFAAAQFEVPWGVSEYDYAGGLKGKPVEVTRGVFTELPVPATAEIVLEGELLPPEVESRTEGPFGEYTGYYASGGRAMGVFKVKAILHRNAPIIQGNPPSRFPNLWSVGRHVQACAALWDELDKQIPGVSGVWAIEDASFRSIVVVSVKQMYAGHAKQVALLTLSSNINARNNRYVIVVDEDIDPANISQVLWALGTRTDPKRSIEFIEEMRGDYCNPAIPRERLLREEYEASRAIIVACRPYHRISEYAIPNVISLELAQKIRARWPELTSE